MESNILRSLVRVERQAMPTACTAASASPKKITNAKRLGTLVTVIQRKNRSARTRQLGRSVLRGPR